MRQDHETFNGSTALVLHTLGEIKADVRTIGHEVRETRRETRADMRGLTRRLDSLESRGLGTILADLLPYLTGVVVLALALAGRWAELGQFLSSGR